MHPIDKVSNWILVALYFSILKMFFTIAQVALLIHKFWSNYMKFNELKVDPTVLLILFVVTRRITVCISIIMLQSQRNENYFICYYWSTTSVATTQSFVHNRILCRAIHLLRSSLSITHRFWKAIRYQASISRSLLC